MSTPALHITLTATSQRVTLPPCVFAPCEWRHKRGQMFAAVGCVQVWEKFEHNDQHGDAGDWIVVGEDDSTVVDAGWFSSLVRTKRVKTQ